MQQKLKKIRKSIVKAEKLILSIIAYFIFLY